jgi:hypothetical protein
MASRNGGNGYTAEQCIAAAAGSRGFVTTVAKRLGCSRTYVYKLIEKFSTFADAIKDEREGLKDFAEGKLMTEIDGGNITAIIFYLKTQAKDRGYVERQELTGADGGAVVVEWDDGSKD